MDAVEGVTKAPRDVIRAVVTFSTAKALSAYRGKFPIHNLVLLRADEAAPGACNKVLYVLVVLVFFSLESLVAAWEKSDLCGRALRWLPSVVPSCRQQCSTATATTRTLATPGGVSLNSLTE